MYNFALKLLSRNFVSIHWKTSSLPYYSIMLTSYFTIPRFHKRKQAIYIYINHKDVWCAFAVVSS